MTKLDFTVGLTAHNESTLVQTAIMSIIQALRFMRKYEVIIHLDDASPATRKAIEPYYRRSHFRIFENHFGDLGASRNFIAEHAKGEYLIFMDGDDLVSPNYFQKFLKILKKSPDSTILHPEYSVTFGNCDEFRFWHMHPSMSLEEDAKILFSRNRWISSVGAHRNVFLENLYMSTEKGYGHEDYNFNIVTAAKGYQHRIADGTAYFYREKPQSLMLSNNQNNCTQPKSTLFDFSFWRNLDPQLFQEQQETTNSHGNGNNVLESNQPSNTNEPHYQNPSAKNKTSRKPLSSPKQLLLLCYLTFRNHKITNFFITPVAEFMKALTGKRIIAERYPPLIMRAWRTLGSLEPQLCFTPEQVKTAVDYECNKILTASTVYYQLCQQDLQRSDYLIIAETLTPEVEKKVAKIRKSHSNCQITVILTAVSQASESSRSKSSTAETSKRVKTTTKTKPAPLVQGVSVIDFGNTAADLLWYDRDTTFSRLIVQTGASHICFLGSTYGAEWRQKSHDFVSSNFTIDS